MNDFRLTDKKIIDLRIAHRATKERKAADRIKAVLLLGTGWDYQSVCEALLLDDDTLRNYVKRYREGGIRELLKRNYKGGKTKLSTIEIKELVAHLEAMTYITVDSIIRHIKRHYKLTYSVSGMTDFLHREGFVYKKTKIIPGKADAEK